MVYLMRRFMFTTEYYYGDLCGVDYWTKDKSRAIKVSPEYAAQKIEMCKTHAFNNECYTYEVIA